MVRREEKGPRRKEERLRKREQQARYVGNDRL